MRRNNSISCFQNQFTSDYQKFETFCKRSFLIGVQKVGEIITFPLCLITFPVCQTCPRLISKSYKHFVKEVF